MKRALDLSSGQMAESGNQCCDGALDPSKFASGMLWKNPLRHSVPLHVEGVKEEDLVRPQNPTSLPPPVDPAPESTDALVAKELYKLSLDDRNRVLEEIHGVQNSSGVVETEELLGESLVALTVKLQSAPANSAFAKARGRDPEYVSRQEFSLMFLRAEYFNAKHAARRMLAFFEYKLELFGEDKLTKGIEIRDLLSDPSDRMVLQSGLFQLLLNRDRSGRIVVGKFQKHRFSHLKLESRLRVFFYMLMTTTEHDIDQKRGIVLLVTNQDGVVDRVDAWRNTTLLGALPVRVNSFHVCHNDPKITALSALAMLAMGPDYRARFRLHEGSVVENAYSLQTFGISSRSIPLDSSTGDVIVESLNRWIDTRKLAEGGSTADVLLLAEHNVSAPSANDVIFGRGKATQNHPGNIRLRKLIDSHLEAYEGAKLMDKTFIAEQVIQAIEGSSGRFLKQAGSGWTEVSFDTARDKISHAFRDRRRKMKAHAPFPASGPTHVGSKSSRWEEMV